MQRLSDHPNGGNLSANRGAESPCPSGKALSHVDIRDDISDDSISDESPSPKHRPRPGAITPLGVRHDKSKGPLGLGTASITIQEMDSALHRLHSWQSRHEQEMAVLRKKGVEDLLEYEELYLRPQQPQKGEDTGLDVRSSSSSSMASYSDSHEDTDAILPGQSSDSSTQEAEMVAGGRGTEITANRDGTLALAQLRSSERIHCEAKADSDTQPGRPQLLVCVPPRQSRTSGRPQRPSTAVPRQAIPHHESTAHSHARQSRPTSAHPSRSHIAPLISRQLEPSELDLLRHSMSLNFSLRDTPQRPSTSDSASRRAELLPVAEVARGDQLLAELEAELADLDKANDIISWESDLQGVLSRMEVLQSGYQALGRTGSPRPST